MRKKTYRHLVNESSNDFQVYRMPISIYHIFKDIICELNLTYSIHENYMSIQATDDEMITFLTYCLESEKADSLLSVLNVDSDDAIDTIMRAYRVNSTLSESILNEFATVTDLSPIAIERILKNYKSRLWNNGFRFEVIEKNIPEDISYLGEMITTYKIGLSHTKTNALLSEEEAINEDLIYVKVGISYDYKTYPGYKSHDPYTEDEGPTVDIYNLQLKILELEIYGYTLKDFSKDFIDWLTNEVYSHVDSDIIDMLEEHILSDDYEPDFDD